MRCFSRAVLFLGACTVLMSLFCAKVRPPSLPVVTGPTEADPGDTLVFAMASTDPDGEQICYLIDWGDGSEVESTAYCPSGVEMFGSHSYATWSRCTVRVRARNLSGDTSAWSEGNVVVIGPFWTWGRLYGGRKADQAHWVEQTSDRGYILAGTTESCGAGTTDVWLVKTDESGETLWTRTYGGVHRDWADCVRQTRDGGYVVAGGTESFSCGEYYHYDAWLLKTDASGDTLWTRTFGGELYDAVRSVQETSDCGFVLAGQTNSFGDDYQAWLIKTDAAGDTLWTRRFGGASWEWAAEVEQTPDLGYILAATTNSYGSGYADAWLIKTDASGDTLWTRTLGIGWTDAAYSVEQTSDGGYVVAGCAMAMTTLRNDVRLIRTDSSGNMLWERTFGRDGWDQAYSVQQTPDGGYVIAGHSQSPTTWDYNALLIRTDAAGHGLWMRTYGGEKIDHALSAQQTTDRGFILAGYSNSLGAGSYDALLFKVDANGQ